MLTVVTTATPEYPRPWVFPSLGMLGCRVVCLLDPSDKRPLPRGVERYPYQTPGVLYQDGRFLAAVPDILDDDLVILADADGIFQRDFSEDELDTLADLQSGFALGYNVRPGQQGAEEYERLRPNQDIKKAAEFLGMTLGTLKGTWIYNTGFMVARAHAWRKLRGWFKATFSEGDGANLFRLPSWPQFFICMVLSSMSTPITELGYETHSHGHCPLTPRHAIVRRQLYYDGKLVLFAHNCLGVSH